MGKAVYVRRLALLGLGAWYHVPYEILIPEVLNPAYRCGGLPPKRRPPERPPRQQRTLAAHA